MTLGAQVLFVLHALAAAALTVLAVRLVILNLHHKYRCFFLYVAFSAARSLFLLAFDVRSSSYYYVYVTTEPVLWLFYTLMVLEIYSLILADHKGLHSLGRWVLYAGLSVSLALSLLSLIPKGNGPEVQGSLLPNLYRIERGVVFGLALFLLFAAVFLIRYPLPLSRNLLIHSAIFAAFFLAKTLGLLTRSFVGHAASLAVAICVLAATLACLVGWILLLKPAGERKTVVLRTSFSPARERELLGELSSINQTLLRAARR